MQMYAERHSVPGMASLYKGQDNRRPAGLLVGTISILNEKSFVLKTEQNEELVINITHKTKIPAGINLTVGSEVLVFGHRTKNAVAAFGIKSAADGRFRGGPTDMTGPRGLR